jgi:hypothetical protein
MLGALVDYVLLEDFLVTKSLYVFSLRQFVGRWLEPEDIDVNHSFLAILTNNTID